MCNPKAREITENLRDGQKSEYRPELVSRVFKLHLAELLNDIKNRHVLGVPIAHVHVIEFQIQMHYLFEIISKSS